MTTSDTDTKYLRAKFNNEGSEDNEGLSFGIGDVIELEDSDTTCSTGGQQGVNLRTQSKGLIPSSENGYVNVEQVAVPYVQPVILLGSMKNQVQDYLVQTQPDNFTTSVPHTTRKARENEVNGVDYFFVRESTMRTMLKNGLFIDCGEYEGNLYGTTEAAVRMVAQREKKHCILDTNTSMVKLSKTRLYPIVLFVGASTYRNLTHMRVGDYLSKYEAREKIEEDREIVSKYASLFNGVILESELDQLYTKVMDRIRWLESNSPFIPLDSMHYDHIM